MITCLARTPTRCTDCLTAIKSEKCFKFSFFSRQYNYLSSRWPAAPPHASTSAMHTERNSGAIIWFRNDLRVTDHPPLLAVADTQQLVCIYCLDDDMLLPRQQGTLSPPGVASEVPRLGPHRCRFLLEAVASLRRDLEARGSSLIFCTGDTASAISSAIRLLAATCDSVQLHYHLMPDPMEQRTEAAVTEAAEQSARSAGILLSVHPYWGATLYHPDDLPPGMLQPAESGRTTAPPGSASSFTRERRRYCGFPSTMTAFRKAVEAGGHVRDPVPAPMRLPPPPPGADAGVIPGEVLPLYTSAGASDALHRLEEITGIDMQMLPAPESGVYDPRAAMRLAGGEQAGMSRLGYYLHGNYARLHLVAAVSTPPDHGTATRGLTAQAVYEGTGEGVVGPLSSAPEGEAQGTGYRASGLGNGSGLADATEQPVESAADGSSGPAPIHNFKESRMLAGGVDNSTKLSAFLAAGCISPQMVHAAVTAAEGEGSEHCQWLKMHLIIRDFFIFTALKAGTDLLRAEGIVGKPVEWGSNPAAVQRWACGSTGLPFVDACMRELGGSGYMSNRGRQNAAGLFCKDLGLDWRLGAAIFESLLVDHDWSVNTPNWAYFAGVGNDPRDRHFNTVSQGEKYDPEAELITSWVPELGCLPLGGKHRPWEGSSLDGSAYPVPCVDVTTQINRP